MLRYLVPAASYLPEVILRSLHRKVPIESDPSDGWTYWMDASYYRWCRFDKKRQMRA
jgi:hypothetical protein